MFLQDIATTISLQTVVGLPGKFMRL